MTIRASAPFAIVFSAVNREILCVVVERSGCPGRLRVASSAIV